MNLPELTSERFIPDPFDSGEGARLYRTGDLVRYDRNGCMQFLGRMDFQVKIRGHRIEPAEIEQQIHQYPGIDQAAVVEQEFGAGDKQLLACIIAAEGEKIPVDDLKEHLRGRIPEYMMPADFMFLDSFPLTPNKKLDRKALAALRPRPGGVKTQKTQFSDGLESQVAQCWMQVLGPRNIGKDDNFFDSGGDSFRAMKLHYTLRKELKIDFPLTDIFSYPTIQSLADYLGRQDSGAGFIEKGLQRGKARRKRFSKGQDRGKGQGS
jgi:acyl carrier protein